MLCSFSLQSSVLLTCKIQQGIGVMKSEGLLQFAQEVFDAHDSQEETK